MGEGVDNCKGVRCARFTAGTEIYPTVVYDAVLC